MSQYQTGTVAVTNGSAAIVGTGTSWTSALEGGIFKVTGVSADYTVTTVTDTTHITLSTTYTGSTNATATYQITQDFTDNYAFREIHAGDREWAWHLTQFIRRVDTEMDALVVGGSGIPPSTFTADSQIIVGTGSGTYAAESGATLRASIGLGTAAVADVDDTPVNGATADPISSNWAYDHVAAADPHTGYVLESAESQIDGALSTDDTYTATELIININGGETIAQWELVYYDTTQTEWMLADADVSGEAPAWGVAVAATSNGAAASVMARGTARNDAWAWTPGAKLYLSDTPGALTETAPSTTGDIIQPVGIAITADIVYFSFDPVNGYYTAA